MTRHGLPLMGVPLRPVRVPCVIQEVVHDSMMCNIILLSLTGMTRHGLPLMGMPLRLVQHIILDMPLRLVQKIILS
jgi:hypothetical protein